MTVQIINTHASLFASVTEFITSLFMLFLDVYAEPTECDPSKRVSITIDDIQYEVIGDIGFVRRNCSEREKSTIQLVEFVTTPEKLSFPVVEIDREVFLRASLCKINIPTNVRVLRSSCFRDCSRLSDVSFPKESQLLIIERSCFRRCSSLSSFACPNSVVEIEQKSFFECTSLTEFSLTEHSHLQRIGKHAFKGCSIQSFRLVKGLNVTGNGLVGVTSIILDNKSCVMNGCFLLSVDTTELIQCFSDNEIITIPDCVEYLGTECFTNCHNMTEIVIGVHSKLIGMKDGALISVKKLTSLKGNYILKDGIMYTVDHVLVKSWSESPHITLPRDVKEIKEYAFHGTNTSIFEIEEDSRLKTIGKCAFARSSIKSARFMNFATEMIIGDKCFCKCEMLESVVFGPGCSIREFHNRAFKETKLTSITIPRHLRKIGTKCFFGCKQLVSVEFELKSELEEIAPKAFTETSVSSIILPPSIKYLSGTSLYGITSVSITGDSDAYEILEDHFIIEKQTKHLVMYAGIEENVVIPGIITKLGKKSFYKNAHIKSIRVQEGSSLKETEIDAFKGCNIDIFHVPRIVEHPGGLDGTYIKEVKVDSRNQHMTRNANGFVCSDDSSTMTRYFGSSWIVHIPQSITKISSICFRNNRCIRSIFFDKESRLSSIGSMSFYSSNLIYVELPGQISHLGEKCFARTNHLCYVHFGPQTGLKHLSAGCWEGSSLRRILIPKGVTEIPERCFSGCRLLWFVDWESQDTLRKVHNHAFHGCLSIAYMSFPNSLVEIGDYALANSGLTSLMIPASVKRLGKGCFSNCRLLEQAQFAYGVTLKRLSDNLFEGSGITTMTIPESVEEIGGRCFMGCSSMSVVDFAAASNLRKIGLEAFAFTSLTSVTLPHCIKEFGDRCFANCMQLEKVLLDRNADTTWIGGCQIFFNSGVSSLEIPSRVETIHPSVVCGIETLTIDENNANLRTHNNFVLDKTGDCVGYYGRDSEVVIPREISTIIEHCFADNQYIRGVAFARDSRISVLREFLFARSKIRSIFIPKSVVEIFNSCFECCDHLEEVIFDSDSRLLSLGGSCFYGSHMKSITIPKSVITIGYECFKDCWNLQSVVFDPECCLESIGSRAFEGTRLESIIIPKHVKWIGCGCFFSTQLQKCECEMGSELSELEEQIFDSLEEFCIPKNVSSITGKALRGISRVTIDPGNKYFSVLGSLLVKHDHTEVIGCFGRPISVTIPNTVHTIGFKSFAEVVTLEAVEFEAGSQLHTICRHAFERTSLKSFTLPLSVTTLEIECFASCEALKEFVIPEKCSLTHIPTGLFPGCLIDCLRISSEVTQIEQRALDNFQSVSISDANPYLKVQGEFICTTNGDLVSIIGTPYHAMIPCWVTTVPDGFFGHSITAVDFETPSRVSILGKEAFLSSKIKSLVIPNSVEVIRKECFEGCTSLESVTFQQTSHLNRIRSNAFNGCTSLVMKLPPTVQFIGGGALSDVKDVTVDAENPHMCFVNGYILNCEKTRLCGFYGPKSETNEIVLPQQIVSIERECFQWTNWLNSLNYEEGSNLTRINKKAFYYSEVSSIEIPPKVEFIGKKCFMGSSLTNIIFNSCRNLIILEESIFEDSTIKSIVIPSSIRQIGRKCFRRTELESITFEAGSHLTEIAPEAFTITKLTGISIPDSVKSIGHRCFAYCQHLENITFSEHSDLQFIGRKAFIGDHKLHEVELPSTIVRIESNAFDTECKLTMKRAPDNFTQWENHREEVFQRARDGSFYLDGSFETVKLLHESDSEILKVIEHRYTKEQYIIRIEKTPSEPPDRRLMNHPCFLAIISFDTQSHSFCYECPENGSLADRLIDTMDSAERNIIAIGIAVALAELQITSQKEKLIIPENVFLDAQNHPKVCPLADEHADPLLVQDITDNDAILQWTQKLLTAPTKESIRNEIETITTIIPDAKDYGSYLLTNLQ